MKIKKVIDREENRRYVCMNISVSRRDKSDEKNFFFSDMNFHFFALVRAVNV